MSDRLLKLRLAFVVAVGAYVRTKEGLHKSRGQELYKLIVDEIPIGDPLRPSLDRLAELLQT